MARRRRVIVNPELAAARATPAEEALRVPYRERRAIRKHLVPRVDRLRRRRLRVRLYAVAALCAFVLAAALLSTFPDTARHLSPGPPRPTPPTPAAAAKPTIFLACVADDRGFITGAALVAYDASLERVRIFTVGPATAVDLLGLGFLRLSSVRAAASDVVFFSLVNEIDFPIDFVVTVPTHAFKDAIGSKRPRELLTTILAGPFTLESRDATAPPARVPVRTLADALGSAALVEVVEFPTRTGRAGEQEIQALDTKKFAEIAEVLLADTFARKPAQKSVLVLDASPDRRAGVEAAFRLVSSGFRVFEVRRAERADRATTTVETYGLARAEGERIVSAIGTGALVERGSENGLVDAAVIVGADFAAVTTSTAR